MRTCSFAVVLFQALLGHARALELQQQIDQAAEVLSEAAVRFSWFVPGLLEHLRLLLAQKEWEGVVESANLVLHAEPDNATALSMLGEWSARPWNQPAPSAVLCGMHVLCNQQVICAAILSLRCKSQLARGLSIEGSVDPGRVPVGVLSSA